MKPVIGKSELPTLILKFVAMVMFVSPAALYAQSCALCYQAAANSGANFIEALKRGILVLLFPPLLIGSCVVIAAYRKRDQYVAEDQASTTN
jgi:K+-transporting ATPase A subunit